MYCQQLTGQETSHDMWQSLNFIFKSPLWTPEGPVSASGLKRFLSWHQLKKQGKVTCVQQPSVKTRLEDCKGLSKIFFM